MSNRRLGIMTKETYADILERHIYPQFGKLAINRITPERVRSWNQTLAARVAATAAKAYRILKAILATAVNDQLIGRNPCTVRQCGPRSRHRPRIRTGGSRVRARSRRAPRLRMMILVAGFGGLRYGELSALRRRHYDASKGTVTIEEAIDKRDAGRTRRRSPAAEQSPSPVRAGRARRSRRDLRGRLTGQPAVFPGEAGGVMSDGWFKKSWTAARKSVGVSTVRFHDLRHTAGTLATQHGATMKEVMSRLGHSTTAAAIRYQRAADSRDQDVADRLDEAFGNPTSEPVAGYSRDEPDEGGEPDS
ncbi:MAG: tyrosine-type recombinase/integrase [Actinobacteria bacterium]|nr:tyrosine-type recombinase/integrase [Actinomycetota bacterium]